MDCCAHAIPGLESLCTCCLTNGTKRAKDVCELRQNVRLLEEETEALVVARTVMRNRVGAAQQEEMRQVEFWCDTVDRAVNELRELREGSTQCCPKLWLGCICADCIHSYNIGERVVKQLERITKLRVEGQQFGVEVAVSSTVIPREEISIDPDVLPRIDLYGEVWDWLVGDKVGTIGLYGMAGIGKTTLLAQINNNLYLNYIDFDVVIWVDKLEDRPVEKIQNKIAKSIGLYNESWEKKHENSRAFCIGNKLVSKKFVLLIDGIWRPITLEKVGVPGLGRNNATHKVIFTTRSQRVCCDMSADKHVEVGALGDEQARTYFKKIVGYDTLEHPLVKDALAPSLVRKCEGHPLVLRAVGRSMKGKISPKIWNDAIEKVSRRSAHEIEDLYLEVYTCLALSYDNLLDETIKYCFLYCSLFSAGYKIPKRDLIDYWIGEGFLQEESEAKHDEGSTIIANLVAAELLEEDGDHVQLDGMIHEMALWIASKRNEQERFFVEAIGGLNEAPQIDKWQGARRMSLMRSKIQKLVQPPTCPRLLTLFLNCNLLQKIDCGFFQNMPILKVLNLSNNPLEELPLETAKLVSLEHLDLSTTSISELPKELEALEKLKCLNLENTSRLRTIPKDLIANFSRIQVLRMLNCGSSQPTQDSVLYDGGIFLIPELLCLGRLEMLSVNLTSSEALDNFLSNHKVRKSIQSLCLQFLSQLESVNVPVEDLGRLDTLRMSDCGDLKELKIDYGAGQKTLGFYSLQVVVIKSCQKLKELTWLILASSLKSLVVRDCSEMREIINIKNLNEFTDKFVGKEIPFLTLEYLELQQLPNLNSIHGRSLPFPKLKEMKVNACLKLKKLPLDRRSVEDRALVIKGQRDWWDKLICGCQAAKDALCFQAEN